MRMDIATFLTFGMFVRPCTKIGALMFFLTACAASIGIILPVQAKTEGEAADQLIAILGVTLPCPRFAVAWLERPATIQYRCTPAIEGAIRLRETFPGERVGYIIDMQVARDRYASAYRFRGAATPAVALAQFLAGNTVPEMPRDRWKRHSSPVIVYSRATVSSDVRDSVLHPP